MLQQREANAAVKALAGRGFKDLSRTDVGEGIIAATRKADQSRVASYAVRTLLNRFDKEAKNLLGVGPELLSIALSIGDKYPLTRPVASRLVATAARTGFCGRFPEMPRRLLKRDPSADEVVALVDAHVANKGLLSRSAQDKLKKMAQEYLSPENAAIQIGRLARFEWEFHDEL